MIHPDQTTATFGEIADEIAKPSSSSSVRESVLLDLCHCALTGLISPGNLGWNVEASLRLLSDDWRPKVEIVRLPAGTVVRPASGPSIPDGTILLDERQTSFLEVTPEIIVGNLAESMSSLSPIARDLLGERGSNAALNLANHLKLHGLPLKDDYGRPLIEGLALSKAGVREFCEHAGWAFPRWAAAPVLATEHCAVTHSGPLLVRRNGHITIPDARAAIWRQRYPNETHCLQLTDDGRLPGNYAEAAVHLHEGDGKLLSALGRSELTAVVMLENGQLLDVEARYWESGGARLVTLEHSTLHTADASSPQWREYHGRPVYIAESEFRPWLDRRYGSNSLVPLNLLESLERYSDPDDWAAFMEIEREFVARGYAGSIADSPVLYVGGAPAGYREMLIQRETAIRKLDDAFKARLRRGGFRITGYLYRKGDAPFETEIPARQVAILHFGYANSTASGGGLEYSGVEVEEVRVAGQQLEAEVRHAAVAVDGAPPAQPSEARGDAERAGAERSVAAHSSRRGRPKGAGSMAEVDAPLVDQMRELIDRGAFTSPTAAAQSIVANAKGAGTTEESKIRRLVRRYGEKFRS